MQQQRSKSVYQLKNGNWGYRFAITVNGGKISQRRTRSAAGLPFKTQNQALKAREQAIKEVQRMALQPQKGEPRDRKRIREVYVEYCDVGRKGKAFATIKNYCSCP